MSNSDNSKNARRWTSEEIELFADILANEGDSYARSLEQLALKKASNNEVYENIKISFDNALKNDLFISINEQINFMDVNGLVRPYRKVDTAVEKLRNKFKLIKKEWTDLTKRVKNCSVLAPEKEPKWYRYLNPIFAETNKHVLLAPCSADLSDYKYVDSDICITEVVGNSPLIKEEVSEISIRNNSHQSSNKIKFVVAPRKKRRVVKSNKQALSAIANSIKEMTRSQNQRHKEIMEAKSKRDQMFMKHREDEAEKNRQHELKIAHIFLTALQSSSV